MDEEKALEVAYIFVETALRAAAIEYIENEVNGFDNTAAGQRIISYALELVEIIDATESLA